MILFKRWCIQTVEYCSAIKTHELSAMKRHRNLNAHWWVKKANLKRLQTVWFQLWTLWKRQNYGDGKKIRGGQGVGGGRDEHRGFLGQWSYSVRYIGCIHHCTFIQTTEYTASRVNSNVSTGLWLMRTYPHRFISCKSGITTSKKDVVNGGSCEREVQNAYAVLTFCSVFAQISSK